MAEKTRRRKTKEQPELAVPAAVAGWLIPGLGHLLLRRWGRALVFFLTVGALAVTGFLLRGYVFPARSADAFDSLGFLADFGAGVFYFLSRFFETSGADISRASGDYGTRFIATAGVLNLLCVLDAYEIACGQKE